MNFQEAFLIMFWPVWARMMGVFVAAGVIVGMYHVLVHSYSFRRPSKPLAFENGHSDGTRSTIAGQKSDIERR